MPQRNPEHNQTLCYSNVATFTTVTTVVLHTRKDELNKTVSLLFLHVLHQVLAFWAGF